MAEKTVLTSIDIDVTKAVQDTQKLREEVDRLKKQTEELGKSQGKTSVEYIKASAQLKATSGELRSHENILAKVVTANRAGTGSIAEMRAELAVVSAQWANLSKAERQNSEEGKKLSARKLELTNALKNEEAATGDARRNVGNYTDAMRGMPGPIGAATGSVQSLGTALKALAKIPILLVITGIVAALAGLVKIFKSTDSGGTELAARMEQLRAVLDVLRQRAITLIGAFKELFSGNFREAGKKFGETFTGIGEQINTATAAAYDYIKALDAIEDAENNYISQSADIRNAIAKLEFTAQDRSKSTEERKKALQDAIALGAQESKQLQEFARQKLELKAAELAATMGLQGEEVIGFTRMTDAEQAAASESLRTLRDNNEAKFIEIEQLYADWINADTKFYEENKRNISRFSGFQKELEKEAEEARVDAERKRAEQAVAAARKELDDFLAIQHERRDIEVQLESEKEDILEQMQARKLEQAAMNYQNELALLEGTLFGELELERIYLEQKEAQEIAAAERIGASTTLVEKKFAKAKKEIARAERDAKLDLARGFLQNIAEAAGEGTAIGKAAAIAITQIETFKGATAAYMGMVEAFPGPWGIAAGVAAAIATGAVGLANVKKIIAVKSGLPGEGAISGTGGGAPAVPTPVAAVNPEIGAGIISRDTTVVQDQPAISLQPTLVVDSVTAKQTDQSAQQLTAVL